MAPDIIVATETWLSKDMKDGEIGAANRFSSEYVIYRKDRADGYGGVFVAVIKSLVSERVHELETDAEVVWVKISTGKSKTLYVGFFYRPHENDEHGHNLFKVTMDRASQVNDAHVWCSGDFNYPGIDWSEKVLKPGCRYPYLSRITE